MTSDPLSLGNKIQSRHQDRLAVVYVRQSTVQQIEKHSESTKLQYALVNRALQLGWSQQRILVIDSDLGISGSTAEGRPGFQRLVAEVGLDHVGIVLGIEMSRLARSCRDWHQLLEVCALFGTLIGDTDGIYDPATYNDRLLLGLKGTMSEAELHILKQRMLEGKRAKARRGELRMTVPMGYIRHPSGSTQKDPDEQAQSVIQLAFKLFEQFATVHAVLRYFVKNKIQMPYRHKSGSHAGELEWRRPNRPTLLNLFHNPTYAGAYVYGRRPVDSRKKKPGRPATGRTVAKPEEWQVLLKDHIPAYITWEQYESNLRQLAKNASQSMGVVRNGPSLLSGLIICGHCRLRMVTQYTNNGLGLRYSCIRMSADYAAPTCQSLKGNPLDECIVDLVLKALKPAALEVSLKVSEDLEAERTELQNHWEQRLERANYEVERSWRQYNAVEPENRLVARSLEQQWEGTLTAQKNLKEEHSRFLAQQPTTLSNEEREAIRKLANDIPTLWTAPTTTSTDKQAIVRHLVEKIIVTVQGNTEKVDVQIHWVGGYQSDTMLIRPVAKLEQLSNYQELMARVVTLNAEGKTPKIIAETLNSEGWRPPKRRNTFSGEMVNSILSRLTQTYRPRQIRIVDRQQDELTLQELGEKLKMSPITLYSWLKKGELKARRGKTSSKKEPWLIYASPEELKRLQTMKTKPRSSSLYGHVNEMSKIGDVKL
jgi:DNA invertase Pin-like site-specific DNA recombinase